MQSELLIDFDTGNPTMNKLLAKRLALKELLKEVKINPQDIKITVEASDSYMWKPPKGNGWSRTNSPKIAIKKSTKRLHVIVSDATSDIYFYK